MIEFLSPVSKSVVAHREVLPIGVLGKQILLHSEKGILPDLKVAKIAILGIKENRNDVDYIGGKVCLDAFRKAVYSLYPGNWTQKIIDLVYSENGETVEDS